MKHSNKEVVHCVIGVSNQVAKFKASTLAKNTSGSLPLKSDSSCQDRDNNTFGPNLLKTTRGRSSRGTRGEDIINQQNRIALQARETPGLEYISHGFPPLRGTLLCESICGPYPSKRLTNLKIQMAG